MVDVANLSQYINQLLSDSQITVNPVVGEIIAALIFFTAALLAGFITYHVIEHYLSKWAKKTTTTLDDEIIKNIKKPVYLLVILVGIYYGVYQISALADYAEVVSFLFLTLQILLVAFIVTRVINVFVAWYSIRKAKETGKELSPNILIVFKKVLHFFVYIFALVAILYFSHIDLSGAVVGLGVGGIAIAFALQSVLADAFSAFSIYFDRPFEIGDFITIGEFSGTVSHISMKSTRLQLIQGEELILSNRSILDKNIQNFKKLQKRRILFSLGVTYDTPSEKLQKIHSIVAGAVGKCPLAQLDRVHFKDFGNSALNFEVVYFINSPDYLVFMDIQQQINYAIKQGFEKEGIEFAFPTQTIHLAKSAA